MSDNDLDLAEKYLQEAKAQTEMVERIIALFQESTLTWEQMRWVIHWFENNFGRLEGKK